MKIIDISWPISPTITGYKNKQTVRFEEIKIFSRDNARESIIQLNSHTGTHVDAPSHFLHEGVTIDQVTLEHLVGPCKVIDMTHVAETITANDLSRVLIEQGDRLLFKTSNSFTKPNDPFLTDFIYLHHSAAEYLAAQKIRCIGIDYLGIERAQAGHPTHITLMNAGISIIEGLRLAHVESGAYTLYCLPLAVVGLEAAPARAILIKN